MDGCSQTGFAASVAACLRDEELYLQLLQDHIANGALARLEQKLELLQEEIDRNLAALSMADVQNWSPRFTCQAFGSKDGLIEDFVAFLDLNIRDLLL